jgi:NTE family protein
VLAGGRADHRNDDLDRRRLDGALTRKTVNLALQGGGAHGAFTWGALDRLLEEEAIEIEGITATSAGAMNAAALKAGWIENGNAGARDWLDRFWLQVSGLDGGVPDGVLQWLRQIAPSPAVTARALEASPLVLAGEAVTRMLSPYQFNPLNYHPMRRIVEEMFDFDMVCAARGPKLFISTTNVRTGKIRVFDGDQINADAILASACLPTLYQAIEIDDPETGRREAYWDGGYMGNPALFPLFYKTECHDTIIVHINPLHREELPHTSTEILNRINEISFNSSLLRELRTIDFVNRLIEEGRIEPTRMKDNHIHSVQDDALMRQLGVATKLTPNKGLLLQLKEAGRTAMDGFLTRHWNDIGARSSVDLRAMFQS